MTSSHKNNWYCQHGKRLLDILISIILLVILAPIMVLIYVIIRITSEGGAIFRQERHGKNCRVFTIFKFRTMYTHYPEKKFVQARHNDPRITPIGRFLRKASIDELPQLINVLRGDMSIVGPRPHAVRMDEQMGKLVDGYFQRYATKPGITGLSQTKGLRGETKNIEKLKERVKYDIKYAKNVSLKSDIYILLNTISVVIKMVNAR